MASPFSCLEEELISPVCHDIFKHPVVLSCSHSFCKGCLQEWWTQRQTQECHVCKKRTKKSSSKLPPPTNLVLKNLCEKYLEEKRRSSSRVSSEDLCAAHGEKLRLFCRDDKQLACVMCVCDLEKHGRHEFSSVDEASWRFKETVRESLKSLKEKLEVFNKVKTTYNQTRDYIKLQAQNTETRIKAQFEALHQFLINEESARISALRQEEAQKSLKITERIEELNKDMTSLSDTIRAAEDLLRANDHVSFLRKYKMTMERVRQPPSATLRTTDRRGPTPGQSGLQCLGQDEEYCVLHPCHLGPQHRP